MFRCCKPNGLIRIDDITTYVDQRATEMIDRMDKFMDISHNRRLSMDEFNKQFLRKKMKVIKTKINEFELTVK